MIHLIQRFGRNITVKRNSQEVVFEDGYAVEPSAEADLTIKASVQNATAEELEALPEGSDTKESKKFYTIERLLPRQGNPPKKGDIVSIDGAEYEIFSSENHTDHNSMNIFYYKAIGLKVSYDA